MPFYVTVPSFGTAIIHSGLADLLDDELPGLPGDRTGRTVLGVGPRPAAQWSLRCGHGSAEHWVEIPGLAGCGQDVAMKGVRLRTEEAGTGVFFTSRDLGIEAMDDRLLHHCIHTDPDGAGPALGEPCVGRRDPWAKPEAIVELLPLPIRSRRDDHRRGSRIPGPIRNCRN